MEKSIIEKFKNLVKERNLLGELVEVKCCPLDAERAIGKTERTDFPLLKGKEKLMEANFLGSRGQAYTDDFGDFSATLQDVLSLSMERSFHRAVFISTLNAVMRHLRLISGTIHCRDQGPGKCAEKVVDMLSSRFGSPKVALVGLQPAIAERVSSKFFLRIADLDPDNIGKKKFGTVIMDGEKDVKEILDWCDVALVTGTSAVNNTLEPILKICNYNKKTVILYGVTIAGISHLLGMERFCPESS